MVYEIIGKKPHLTQILLSYIQLISSAQGTNTHIGRVVTCLPGLPPVWHCGSKMQSSHPLLNHSSWGRKRRNTGV